MKVGNLVNGLAVVDVKRVNKMNLIQFTKAVSEYIEQGYKLDVHSSRQIGLVLQVDLYKLESNVGYVGDTSTEGVGLTEDAVKEPNETTIESLQESTKEYKVRLEKEGFSTDFVDSDSKEEVVKESEPYNPENVVLKINDVEVEGFNIKEVEETTPPVKKTRTKKTT